MVCVQSLSIHADAACAHAAECGSVFNSGARATCGTEKLAVGDATSQTASAAKVLMAHNASSGMHILACDFIGFYWRAAFLSSGAISYAFSNSARDSASFPSWWRANARL